MSDLAICARNLRKVYRLYTKNLYRLLDVFGMLRRSAGAYTEHVALADINLEIRRGEKVAFIGRNGAGKSTLLKLATGVTVPTSGRIDVFGKTQALLQLGTGFHPDFTGRENVIGYLGHMGITGKEAQACLRSIVEFAELEEYINQPVKTYSTGMGVRLMFATSTVVSPDILVLDEVLGVGDAYFARKSYERIRELCQGHGTTVLLVSHDIYSAAKICERMIWIDRGRILLDAPSPTIVKAYEDSVREQEERRLRKKKLDQMGIGQDQIEHFLIEIRSQENRPLPCPVYFSRIALLIDGQVIDTLPLGLEATPAENGSQLRSEGTCWGEPLFWQARQARPMLHYGSCFHKVAGVFAIPAYLVRGGRHAIQVVLEYWSAAPCSLGVAIYHKDSTLDLGSLSTSSAVWAQHTCGERHEMAVLVSRPERLEVSTSGHHGTGVVTISNVKCVNREGHELFCFQHGEPIEFHIAYRINKPDLCERSQVMIALHRDGVQDACRFITRNLLFDAGQRPAGVIVARLARLPLSEGKYTVTVMVVKEGYYDSEQTLFYTINPGVYACMGRTLELVVQNAGLVGSGTMVVLEAEWSLRAGSSRSVSGSENDLREVA